MPTKTQAWLARIVGRLKSYYGVPHQMFSRLIADNQSDWDEKMLSRRGLGQITSNNGDWRSLTLLLCSYVWQQLNNANEYSVLPPFRSFRACSHRMQVPGLGCRGDCHPDDGAPQRDGPLAALSDLDRR